jgi:hypothetical protein
MRYLGTDVTEHYPWLHRSDTQASLAEAWREDLERWPASRGDWGDIWDEFNPVYEAVDGAQAALYDELVFNEEEDAHGIPGT